MNKNIGGTDKYIRLAMALVIGVLFYTKLISGNVALLLGIIGVVLALTSLIGFCPLYRLLGITTCQISKK